VHLEGAPVIDRQRANVRPADRRTLRARLSWFYGVTLALILAAFSIVVYVVVEAGDEDPPEVAEAEHTGRHLLYTLLAALPVAIAVGVGGTVIVTRRAVAPLEEMIATTERLTADALSLRVAAPAGMVDEVARLVAAVNGMLERLERSVEAMRRFTADASHELRTPMAALMGNLELTLRHPRSPDELRQALESALEDLGGWSRLVDALLTLARSDSGGLSMRPERLDLGELVRRTLEPFEPLFSERQLQLSCISPGVVTVELDPLWLGRVLANLIDNACKFTPPGGRVEVRVDGGGAGGRARVVVEDTAPLLDGGERERVFERFYRADAERGKSDGFGLGLALARQMARAMGADVRCEPGALGGNRFLFDAPLTPLTDGAATSPATTTTSATTTTTTTTTTGSSRAAGGSTSLASVARAGKTGRG
jgi:signal transduction histidine kinase